VYTLTQTKIIVPCHKLGTARIPDGIRVGHRDGRVDHDTFHDRKSICKLKRNGVEDDAREEKHDDPRVKRKGILRDIASSTPLL